MQRIALIGAGGMAGVHADAYSRIPNARVVAVLDVNRSAAETLAKKLGAPACTAWEDLPEFDAVDICTPTGTHMEYVERAASAGKHVVLEKPMARTLDDCRTIIRAVERSGITFMVAQVLRFFPQFAEARRRVLAGEVGVPITIRSFRGGPFPGGWYGDYTYSGGVVMDTLLHDFDWLLWTFGPATKVCAVGTGPRMGELGMDYATVLVTFASGATARVDGNWSRPPCDFAAGFRIVGDKGRLDCADIPNEECDPYQLELAHFIDCAETGRKPSVTPEESMAAVELALAALRSIEEDHRP
ncbi:MAG: Gfo/Idh/MocA family protein [Armatimonadota bacterium]